MKLVSFDVGIKNMAYCLFDISGESIKVDDWNVINLMPDANKQVILCTCEITIKGNKAEYICFRETLWQKSKIYKWCTVFL